MMKSNKYWQNRAERLIFDHMRTADDIADEIDVLYQKSSKWLIYESRKVFERFKQKYHLNDNDARRLLNTLQDSTSIDDLLNQLKEDPKNKLLLSQVEAPAYQFRINRLRQLQNQLDLMMQDVYNKQRIVLHDYFLDFGSGAYYQQLYELSKHTGYSVSFSMIDNKTVEEAINTKWSGSNYSYRLWKNSKSLAKTLKEELLINLVTGRPEGESVKIISNKFKQGAFETRRLIRTESAFLAGEMNARAYKEYGSEQYQFVATLDLRTSTVCRNLDGERFSLKEKRVGVNFPPMHPWCRSTTIAIIEPDQLNNLKRRALNPDTGRTELIPATMTYWEWYDTYVRGSNSAQMQEKAIHNRSTDREQFKRYKASGIDGVPATLAEFQRLKYQEPRKYEELKKAYVKRVIK